MREKLLGNAVRSGLYYLPPGHRKSVETSSAKLQFQFLQADLSDCRSMTEALGRLGKCLHFPDWYGANLDALFDCLSDPAWLAAPGKVLTISGIESLRFADPAGLATLIEVFQAAVDARHETGQPFWLLLDAAVPGIAALPEA